MSWFGRLWGSVRSSWNWLKRTDVHAGSPPGRSWVPHVHHELSAVLNGVAGDHLERRASRFTRGMAVRIDESEPTSKLCFYVPGLMATHRWWAYSDDPSEWYGSELQRDLGYTPARVVYNTGRAIDRNGSDLADHLEQVVCRHPVPVREIAFVAHSMGGLVLHRAVAHAGDRGHTWVHAARHVALLGVPHAGSPLERGGHVVTQTLRWIPHPVVRRVGEFADLRSTGIKDLRYGGSLHLRALPEVPYYVAAATLGDGSTRVQQLLGDVFVPVRSAEGRASDGRLLLGNEPAAVTLVPNTSHLGLMRSRAVGRHLQMWFGGER